MQRSQLIAVLVLIVVGAGLLAARYATPDGVESASPGAGGASGELGSATATGPGAETAATPSSAPAADEGPERLGPAPDLVELDGWLQTDATSLDDFDGQVRIVHFWTFACHNCKATLPYLQDIYAAYQPQGLEIIGVHAPEFDFEREPDAIAAAAAELGVTWPIALDTSKTNFHQWQPGRTGFWPRTFVVDQNGELRFDHIGEGAYDELEATVAYLVENGP
jgi:thiol-disulfide isomerase/thioredoxin